MSIFVSNKDSAGITRLGASTFQPLGSWPVSRNSGGFGFSGSAQPPTGVPTNVQGYYTLRRAPVQNSDQLGDYIRQDRNDPEVIARGQNR